MPVGINTGIKWSMLELRGLLEDEDARVYFQRSKRHLGLHPFQLNDLNKALREILSSKVNFYDSELQGLVLAYKNPKLLDPLGGILHDSFYIHMDIESDFYIFRPELGCTLKGVANKKAGNHLGVLVHKAFNVSILKADECQEWLGDYVFVGQEVKFTVTHLDFKGKLPFIRGELIPDPTMGQIFYDVVKMTTEEEKPTRLFDEENSEVSDARNKESMKSRVTANNEENGSDSSSVMDDFDVERRKKLKKETADTGDSSDQREKMKKLGSRTKNLVDERVNGQSKTVDSKDSSDDGDKVREPGSSMKKLMDVRARRKLASQRKRSNIESDTSESETLRKKEIRNEETDSSVEEKPKIFEPAAVSEKTVKGKHKRTRVTSESDGFDSSNEKDDIVKVPIKSSRKNRIFESDDEGVVEIDVKPDIKAKKKKKKKDEEERKEEEEEEKMREKYKVKNEDEEEERKKSKKKSKEKEDENEERKIKKEKEAEEEEEEKKKRKKKTKAKENEAEDEEHKIKKEDEEEEEERKKRKKKTKAKENEAEDEENKIKKEDEEDERRKKTKKKSKEKENEDDSDSQVEKTKKKSKKYKVPEEIASESHAAGTTEFEFVKPDLDLFEIPAVKCKRKRQKTITETDEASECTAENNQEEIDFFRDVRVKVEPDPSDAEDSVPRTKGRKRKKSQSTNKEEDEDLKERREFFGNVEIKEEPDMSDIEGTKRRKKKSKRRTREDLTFEDVKVKEELVSDVEGSSISNRSFKSEPDEESLKYDQSTARRV